MALMEETGQDRCATRSWTPAPRSAEADVKPERRELAGGCYYLVRPPVIGPGTRLLVTVHGISRNAREHACLFGRIAARLNWVVMAPRFDQARFPDYQRLGLGKRGTGQRADHMLNTMLDDLARWAGLDCNRFCLFGFSGGGQFAHRYALLYPHRVLRLGVAAAGAYTFPDHATPFPRGLKLGKEPAVTPWRLEATLCVPTAVFVGTRDLGRGEALRTGPRIDAQQGRNRVERAQRWVGALRRARDRRGLDTPVMLVRLSGCGHDFRQCVKKGALNYEVLAFFTEPGQVDGAQGRLEPDLLRFLV